MNDWLYYRACFDFLLSIFSLWMFPIFFIYLFDAYTRQKKEEILNQVQDDGPFLELQLKIRLSSAFFVTIGYLTTKADIIITPKSLFCFRHYSMFGLYRTYHNFMQLYINTLPLPEQLVERWFMPIYSITFHQDKIIIKYSYGWRRMRIALLNIKDAETMQQIQRLLDPDYDSDYFYQAYERRLTRQTSRTRRTRRAHQKYDGPKVPKVEEGQSTGLLLVGLFIGLCILPMMCILLMIIVQLALYNLFVPTATP